MGLHLDHQWSPADGVAKDVHGIVTTYQQVSTADTAKKLRGLANDAFVILDEVHHAGDERAWGDGVRTAFELANRRLSLSGTPFRSDTASIPFVRYEETGVGGEAQPDFTYGYADALRDGGVVRPVYFPRFDGLMEWSAPDGSIISANFHDDLDRAGSSHRLRAALSLEGDWLAVVMAQAHGRLMEIRRASPTLARWPSVWTRSTPATSCGSSAPASRSRRRWSSATTRTPATRSPRSPPVPARGWSRCAWSARVSTFLDCGWACTPAPSSPSCSSARPSVGSCAGRRGWPARRRTSTCPTTRACASTRSRSPRPAATCCARRPSATTSSARKTSSARR
jgi:hypothetical protein